MGDNVICTLGLVHITCCSFGSATSTLWGLEQVTRYLDPLTCPWLGDEAFNRRICAVDILALELPYQRTEVSPATRLQRWRKADV